MPNSCASPFSRRSQRSRPPTTADSTSSRSQRAGARSVPARTGSSSSSGRSCPAASPPAAGSARRSSSDACAGPGVTSGALPGGTQRPRSPGGPPPASSRGTWPRERYSENRRAERCSAAQASSARKARPAGSGTRVPLANQDSMPARSSAVSSSPAYTPGDRNSTAIRSKGTPRAASARMERAISTASRPSPGAEKKVRAGEVRGRRRRAADRRARTGSAGRGPAGPRPARTPEPWSLPPPAGAAAP